MRLLKYNGIIFDDWTEDEHGVWAEMCEHCLEKYGDALDSEIDSAGGCGACSVKGCDLVGMDDDVEMCYIDFDMNGIEIIDVQAEEMTCTR